MTGTQKDIARLVEEEDADPCVRGAREVREIADSLAADHGREAVDSLISELVMLRDDAFGAPPARTRVSLSQRLRDEVMARDDFRCRVCGSRRELRIDHVVPLARGGSNQMHNLRAVCHTCNSERGAQL